MEEVMKSTSQWAATLALALGTAACGSNGSFTAPTAEMSGSFALSGRVVEATGPHPSANGPGDQFDRPSPGTRVEVSGEAYVRSTFTDSDGRYVIDGLTAGWFRISVQKPGYQTASTEIELLNAQQMDFRLSEIDRTRTRPAREY